MYFIYKKIKGSISDFANRKLLLEKKRNRSILGRPLKRKTRPASQMEYKSGETIEEKHLFGGSPFRGATSESSDAFSVTTATMHTYYLCIHIYKDLYI